MLIGRYTAVLDACVLHPAFVRGALLWFAAERLFRPLGSAEILHEWQRSLARKFPDLTPDRLALQRQVMEAQFEDALVFGYEPLVPTLTLPDPDDRHVLAAAILGRADAIVTANLRDFPVAQTSLGTGATSASAITNWLASAVSQAVQSAGHSHGVEHNTCRNSMGQGITLGNARASRIRFNDAAAIPGSRLLKTGQLIKTQVSLHSDDPNSLACGNNVPNVPRSPASQPCQ